MNARTAHLPLGVYGVMYVGTCLIGALLLLWSPALNAIEQVLAGAEPFWLSPEHVLDDLFLLIVCPLAVAAGYEAALRLLPAPAPARAPGGAGAGRLGPRVLVWAASCLGAFASLGRGGALGLVPAWGNYRAWVFARWQLFDRLSSWEFVNIYIVVPLATALVVLCVLGERPSPGRFLRAAAFAVPMIAIDLLVFQKKTLIVSILIVGLAVAAQLGLFERAGTRRFWLGVATLAVLGWIVYVSTILRPTIGRRAQSMTGPGSRDPGPPAAEARVPASPAPPAAAPEKPPAPPTPAARPTAESNVGPTGKPIVESRRTRAFRAAVEALLPGRWIGNPPGTPAIEPLTRGKFLTLYVLLGPILRTPLPALMYPAVYPEGIPYFAADIGLDVFGKGRMPYDNIQIHRLMWPTIEGGTVMVPCQFTAYSQGGLGAACVASLLAGFGLAALWVRVRSAPSGESAALGSALVVLLAIYLAGDSIRNSLLASYGVLWGFLLVGVLAWATRPRAGATEGAR